MNTADLERKARYAHHHAELPRRRRPALARLIRGWRAAIATVHCGVVHIGVLHRTRPAEPNPAEVAGADA